MPAPALILDRYILRQMVTTLGAVFAVILSLMVLEHIPRLIEITSLSGHRGFIVWRMVAGLLPEYAGIGLLAGLYLAVALMVRRLAMRGELDVIEACGIGPWRWMRVPALLTIAIGILTLLNQGWLMPSGERTLDDLGRRMALGQYGYNLTADEFVEIGKDGMLSFKGVDPRTHRLTGLFLKASERTITAASGQLMLSPGGDAVFEFFDGQEINGKDNDVVRFARLHYRLDKPAIQAREESNSANPVRLANLDTLLFSSDAKLRSVAWGRMLWGMLALILPVFASVLGKPPRREASAFGILFGMTLFVLCLKMLSPLTDGQTRHPAAAALAIAACWLGAAVALVRAESFAGQGFFDKWAMRLVSQSRLSSLWKATARPQHRIPRAAARKMESSALHSGRSGLVRRLGALLS